MDKETKLARNREYRRANRDMINARERARRSKVREHVNAQGREYYRLHKKEHQEAGRKWRANNRHKLLEIKRRGNMKRYGITPEIYDEMFQEQAGACFICKQPESNGRRLSVDHNHETDEVRALLCNRCNRLVGMIENSPEMVDPVQNYLLRFAASGIS